MSNSNGTQQHGDHAMSHDVTVKDVEMILKKVQGLSWSKDYELQFYVDVAEPSELRRFFSTLNCAVKVTFVSIPQGDYYYILRNKRTGKRYVAFIFERKTWSDVFGSVQARWRAQKLKLWQFTRKHSIAVDRVGYLIEKSFVHHTAWKGQMMLHGAMFNLHLRDRMDLLRTEGVVDTQYNLLFLMWKIHDLLKKTSLGVEVELSYPLPEDSVWLDKDYLNDVGEDDIKSRIEGGVKCTCDQDPNDHFLQEQDSAVYVARPKKSRGNRTTCISQLREIPKVGPQCAKALQERFTSMGNICAFVRDHSQSPHIAVKEIAKLRTGSAKSTIGESRAASIVKFLMTTPPIK